MAELFRIFKMTLPEIFSILNNASIKPMIHGSTFVEQQMLNEGAATC